MILTSIGASQWRLRAGLLIAGLACIAAFAGAGSASAQQWPRMRTPNDESECALSLGFAKSVFTSTTPLLRDANTVPDGVELDLLVPPTRNSDTLDVDTSAFDIVTSADHHGIIYWHHQSYRGMRLVVAQQPFSWAGDHFALFALPEAATADDLWADLKLPDDRKTFVPVLDFDWSPPLIARDRATGTVFAIDVGPPYIVLRDWNVFTVSKGDVGKRCAIQFRPDVDAAKHVDDAWELLPDEVRKLADLVDGTLGTGRDDGSLRQTARNRLAAAHAWANAAMRPWVYTGADSSEARKNTLNLLEAWSGKAKSFAAHYAKIKLQYPRAQAALTDYYRREFGMSASDAAATARAAIDMSVVANY